MQKVSGWAKTIDMKVKKDVQTEVTEGDINFRGC